MSERGSRLRNSGDIIVGSQRSARANYNLREQRREFHAPGLAYCFGWTLGTIFGHTAKPVAGTLRDSLFEPASLVALVVYGLIGGILLRVLTRPRQN